MSAPAATAERRPVAPAGAGIGPPAGTPADGQLARVAQTAAALAVAGAVCFVTFVAGGGLALASMTTVEMALTIAAGLALAGAVLPAPRGARAYGIWPAVLLGAMTTLTALSVSWSVAPDSSWQDAGRMLAYSGVFGAAAALARAAPRGWTALLAGVVLASVVVCGYALLTKVFPAQLDAHDMYARLQQPYGYWNAIGLTAALGAIGCLWLGARRSGHALLSATAYPAMGVLLVTLMLAYSRGALAALAVGLAVWLSIVPLRLRGARVLIVGGLAAAAAVAWDFSKHALTSDGVSLAARSAAGHQLGVVLAAMVLVLGVAGVTIGFFGDRRAPSRTARRRVSALLLAALVLALAGGAGGLALSKRGLTGTISHDFSSLTDPNAPVPANTPGRLTAIGSVRARYWKEALDIFKAHPAVGVGALGYETARRRYRKETLDVRHAHGYIVQTLADLGIAGLAITLGLLAGWLVCAARATRPLDRRLSVRRTELTVAGRRLSVPRGVVWPRAPSPYTPERIGLLSMLCLAVVFGVHSFVDWTWYVPGNACVALLCAGWLAGRGPLGAGWAAGAGPLDARAPQMGTDPSAATDSALDDTLVMAPTRGRGRERGHWRGRVRTDPRSLAIAAGMLAAALLAAWTEWQPQRSVQDSERALGLIARDPAGARAAAESAVSHDPLSAQALFTLSAVQRASDQAALARATLQKAVRLQPSDPQTWLALGQYDRTVDPRAAVNELRAAVYLDPRSVPIQNAYVEALRATAQNRPRSALASSTRRAPGTPPAPRTSTLSKR